MRPQPSNSPWAIPQITNEWMSTHPSPENRQARLEAMEPEMLELYDPNARHEVYPL